MKPIYKPKGRAGEYGDFAINIYRGCNHGCTYCYARMMAKRWGRDFDDVRPYDGIVDAAKKQLESMEGKTIHLCFTCDPYPADVDTSVTREIIKAIKDSGNHVQILTKGGDRARRDFDLLDGNDWFGVTITGRGGWLNEYEPKAAPFTERLSILYAAHNLGVKTWISLEPVIFEGEAYGSIREHGQYVDMFKIGKLNYAPSSINWAEFGRECERLCKEYGRNYYIKDDLRREMEANP